MMDWLTFAAIFISGVFLGIWIGFEIGSYFYRQSKSLSEEFISAKDEYELTLKDALTFKDKQALFWKTEYQKLRDSLRYGQTR